jgi:tetratricopeptide (TPR) repeat protein
MFQKAIRLNPISSPLQYNSLGLADIYAGRVEESVSTFKQALRQNPIYFVSHFNMAEAYIQMGRERRPGLK